MDSGALVEDAGASKINSNMKYFDYHKRPEDVRLEEYMKVYDAFCKAYGIKSDDIDRRKFSDEVNTNIYLNSIHRMDAHGKPRPYAKHSIMGVNHRPTSAGNKLNAMLMIIPLHGYVRFHAYSYDGEKDHVGEFIRLADNNLHVSKNKEKSKDLESRMR